MDAYAIALFLHIVGSFGMISALGLEFFIVRALRRATTVDQIGSWSDVYRTVPILGGMSLLFVLLSGLYMMATVQGLQPWIGASLVAVVLIAALGASAGIPMRRLLREKAAAPNELRIALSAARFVLSIRLRIAILIGAVALMVFQPDVIGGIVTLVLAIVLGVVWSAPAWLGGSLGKLEGERAARGSGLGQP